MPTSTLVSGLLVLGAVLAFAPADAQTNDPQPATVPAAATTTCDSSGQVCGVMFHDRLVAYPDACRARMAGASRILVGPCDDDD